MLRIVPLHLRQANALVKRWHRHHKPVQGNKFAIGVVDDSGELRGAAICGRPEARMIDQRTTIEVTRLVTDGTKNACSMLYSAAARVAREMGYQKIITYVLDTESGHSVMVAGWEKRTEKTDGRQWKHTDGKHRRTDQPNCDKWQWFKILSPEFAPDIRLHIDGGDTSGQLDLFDGETLA